MQLIDEPTVYFPIELTSDELIDIASALNFAATSLPESPEQEALFALLEQVEAILDSED